MELQLSEKPAPNNPLHRTASRVMAAAVGFGAAATPRQAAGERGVGAETGIRMARKLTTAGVSVIAMLAFITAICFFHQRRASLQMQYAQSFVLENAYDVLQNEGAETAKAYIGLMTLDRLQETESLLAHPLRPWWPRRKPSGSYEKESWPFWAWPVPRSRLERDGLRLQQFEQRFGITNQQQQAELRRRLISDLSPRGEVIIPLTSK